MSKQGQQESQVQSVPQLSQEPQESQAPQAPQVSQQEQQASQEPQEQQMDIGNEELMPAGVSSSLSSSSSSLSIIECPSMESLERQQKAELDEEKNADDTIEHLSPSADDDESDSETTTSDDQETSEDESSENNETKNERQSPIVSIEAVTLEQLEKDQLISEIVVLRSQNEQLSRALELSQHQVAQQADIVETLERDKRELMERLAMSKSQLEHELRVVMEENQKLRAQLDALAAATKSGELQLLDASGEHKSIDDLSIKYPSLSRFMMPSMELAATSESTPSVMASETRDKSLNERQRRELEQLDARLVPSAPTVSLLMGADHSHVDPHSFEIVRNVNATDSQSRAQNSQNNQNSQNTQSLNQNTKAKQVNFESNEGSTSKAAPTIDANRWRHQRSASNSNSINNKNHDQEMKLRMQIEMQSQQQQLAMLREDYHAERLAKLQVMSQLEALRLSSAAQQNVPTGKGRSKSKKTTATSGKSSRTRDADKRARTAPVTCVRFVSNAGVNSENLTRPQQVHSSCSAPTTTSTQILSTSQREIPTYSPSAAGSGIQAPAPPNGGDEQHQHVSKRELKHAARAARHAARDYARQQEKLARHQARHDRHHNKHHHSHHHHSSSLSSYANNPVAAANNLTLSFDDINNEQYYDRHCGTRRHRRRRAAAAGAAAATRVARNLLHVAEPLVADIVHSANRVLVTGARYAGEQVVRNLDRLAERAQQQQQQEQQSSNNNQNHNHNQHERPQPQTGGAHDGTMFERQAMRVASCVARALHEAARTTTSTLAQAAPVAVASATASAMAAAAAAANHLQQQHQQHVPVVGRVASANYRPIV